MGFSSASTPSNDETCPTHPGETDVSDLSRLSEIFDRAVDLSGTERERYLAEACGSRSDLRAAVEALLAQDVATGTPLDASLDDLVGLVLESEPPLQTVGPYRILRELGRGGMGTVYLAERMDGLFDKRVAIKVVRRGMDTEEILGRFRAERQILATLEHPNIARLYDGGMTDDGRPYLVMEYVDGKRITDYVADRRLDPAARVALLREVAGAVSAAHRNLVVHRDLKPSNILVTDGGSTKLLDFGIAKLLSGDLQDRDQTIETNRVLTPTYASPEQVAGETITTASDVFSLGVVLHEMLTGHRPLWRGEDVVAPSVMVSTVWPNLDGREPAPSASSSPPNLDRLPGVLRGDLDAILLKALERDPDRRYSTVDLFIDDLDRWASARPVHARAPSTAYRARRFVRRNRIAVGAAVAVVVSLALGLGLALQQRNLAIAERDAADVVTRYLEQMFESTNPVGQEPGADTLRVADFLDRSTERALIELEDQPEIKARMMRTLGRAHFSLGNFARAQELWQLALEAHTEAGTPPPLGLERDVVQAAMGMAQWAVADSLMDRLLRRALAEEADSVAVRVLSLQVRSHMEQDRTAEAGEALGELIPRLRAAADSNRLADALYMQAGVHFYRGEAEEALVAQREGLALFRALRGPDDPQVAIGLTNLGVQQRNSGRLLAADSSFSEALRIHEARTPRGHPALISAYYTYASLVSQQGDHDRADSLYTLAAAEATDPGARQVLTLVLTNHAGSRRQAGDAVRALELSRRAVDLATDIHGVGSPSTMPHLVDLAISQDFAGDSAGAERTYARAAEAAGDVIPLGNIGRIIAERGVARGLSRQGRHGEAEARMLELMDRLPENPPPGSQPFVTRQASLRELAALYRRWGRVDEAARYEALRAASSDAPGS